jgi:hypothetical protein
MTSLLERAHALKLISNDQRDALSRFRSATHFFEWGTHGVPAEGEIQWALESGPRLIEQLQKVKVN